MCGAGGLPARMAGEARRRGWRVVAFTFDELSAPAIAADLVLPASFAELGAVLGSLHREGARAVLFSGRFSMREVVRTDAAGVDTVARAINERAGSRIDAALAGTVISTLAGLGIDVLDQRPFFGDALASAGAWSKRGPTEAERADIARGFAVARMMAEAHVGQTVVVRHGAVTAVEAVEGTTEAVRRGAANAGPGAVVVKAVARDHDYRFDVPAIGLETVQAAIAGGVAVVAVEAARVVVLDREAITRAADDAGLALVGVDGSDLPGASGTE
jgi:DUF1009 family protein